ncbi:unnamed protein product [Closterium sp. Naga37s-1]|nr:unnamed protein product [Closterium sp. Naga37s-1]
MFKAKNGGSAREGSSDILDDLLQPTQPQNKHHRASATRVFMAPKFKKPRSARGLTGGGQSTLPSLGHANLVEKGRKVNRLLHKTMSNAAKKPSTTERHLQPSLRVRRSRDLGPPLHSEPQLHPQVRAGSRASETLVEGGENAGGHMGVIATRGMKRKAGADGPGGIPPLHAMAPGSKRKPLAAIDNLQSAAPGNAVSGGFLLQSASGRKVNVSAAAAAGVMKLFGEDGEWQQEQQGMKGPQGQQGQQGMEGQQWIQGQQDMQGAEGKQEIRGCMALVPVTNESTAAALTTALNPSPLSLPPEPPPQPPHTAVALISTALNPSPLSMLPSQPPPARPPAGAASLFQTARGKPVPLSSAAVDKACALLGVQQRERPRFGNSAHLGGGSTEGSTVGAGLFQTASNKPVRLSSAAVDKACALLGVQQYKGPQFVAPQITPPIHTPAALLDAQGHERQSSHVPAAMELSVRNSAAELAVVAQPDGGARLGEGVSPGGTTVGAGLFQTARGKPVSVSSAAVDKACALLGVQQGPPALLDAQGHERQSCHTPAGMELSVRNPGAELAQPSGGATMRGANWGEASVGAGLFQTARGKPVSVSSAAVDKACALLGVQQEPPAPLDAQGHERQSTHAPAGMELSVRNPGAKLAQPDGGATMRGANQGGASVRAGLFQTARGKPVSVSSAAVDKACALLDMQQGPPALLDAQGHERQSSHAPAGMELSVWNPGAELAVVAQVDGRARLGGASGGGATVGAGLFQTGRGKPVSVSSAAVDKACALLGVQQRPPALLNAQENERESAHAPAGMELSVRNSGAELAVMAQPDGGARLGGASRGGATVRAGLFQTGRGKPVSLSSAAVDKACALLGVQQSGRPKFEAPRISCEPAALLLEDTEAEQTNAVQAGGGAILGSETVGEGLFQTARGKPVHVSSAAVDKACALLGVQQYKGPPQMEAPRISDEPAVLLLEGAGAEQMRAAQPDSRASWGGATVRTTLFQTASEKPVSLSSAAVDKACALLGVQQHQRPRFEGSASLEGSTVRTAGLFQTASKKPVHISSAAVDKACALFGVQQRERPQVEGSASLGGATVRTAGLFQTASKKPVVLSSAAVDEACAFLGLQQHERPRFEAPRVTPFGSTAPPCPQTLATIQPPPHAPLALPAPAPSAPPPPLTLPAPDAAEEPALLRPPSPPSWPLALTQPSSQGAVELASPAPSPHTPSLAQPPPVRSSPPIHSTSPLHPCPPLHPSSPLHRSRTPSHPSNSPLHPSHTPLHSSPNRLHNAPLHTSPTPLHRPGTTLRRPLTPLNRSPSTLPSPRRQFVPPTSTIPSLFSKHRPPRSRSAGLPPIPMRSLTDAADPPSLDINQKAAEGRMTADNGAVSMSRSGLRTDAAGSGAGAGEGAGAAMMIRQVEGGLRKLHDLYKDEEGKPRRRPCMAEFFGYPPGLERVEGKVSEAVRKMTAESALTFVASAADGADAVCAADLANRAIMAAAPSDAGDAACVAGVANAADSSAGAAGAADLADRINVGDIGGDAGGVVELAIGGGVAAVEDVADTAGAEVLVPVAPSLVESSVCPGVDAATAALPALLALAVPSASPAGAAAEGATTEGGRWALAREGEAKAALTVLGARNGGESASVGAKEFQDMLIAAGAQPKFATLEWVTNHFRWVVWKLACQERSFPRRLAGRMLTVEKVLEQLKYRYEREVNEAKRSALKKVCERDAAAGSPMVLCISAVRSQAGASGRGDGGEGAAEVDKSGGEEEEDGEGRGKRQEAGRQRGAVAGATQTAVIEVTDGWYCPPSRLDAPLAATFIAMPPLSPSSHTPFTPFLYWLPARLDSPLTDLLHRGRLFIGQKIRVCGAVLNGCMEGLPPLEVSPLLPCSLDSFPPILPRFPSFASFAPDFRSLCL